MHVAVVPVGRMDEAEVEAALARAAKVVHQPFELRRALPLPPETDEPQRGQHRAATLLSRLRAAAAKLAPGRLVGADDPAARPPLRPDAFLFVTDADLYTAKTEGVIAAVNVKEGAAVVSVRRLREAFWRRKADPTKQRTRLVKEILRMWGRLIGAAECTDPTCVLAPTRGAPDLDSKAERFCRRCSQRVFEGRVSI